MDTITSPISQANRNPRKSQTPEEDELALKKAELAALQTELGQKEVDLATLKAELRAFEGRYLHIVGIKYAELDDLEARIAEAIARTHPQDLGAREKAVKARSQAEESIHQTCKAAELAQKSKFTPSDELKKLYREVAKKIHPDLAEDEKDRRRRQKSMAEANVAYEAGDVHRLEQVLQEWERSPESVKGDGTAAELVRVIRKIAQVQERLNAMDAQMAELKTSDLWKLRAIVEEAEAAGSDLLAQMVTGLEGRIAAAKTELDAVVRAAQK